MWVLMRDIQGFFILLMQREMKKIYLAVIYAEEYVVIQFERYLIETFLGSLCFSFFLEVNLLLLISYKHF